MLKKFERFFLILLSMLLTQIMLRCKLQLLTSSLDTIPRLFCCLSRFIDFKTIYIEVEKYSNRGKPLNWLQNEMHVKP